MSSERNPSKKDWLKPENMVSLYARGAFPMADEKGVIDWFMPEVRTIIPLNNYNVPRSLKKFLQSSDFEFSIDEKTIDVVRCCAERESTWISEELIEAYKGIHRTGHLHSVEVYHDKKLVGGLYGVTYRGAFFGESMFSKIPQASKSALVKLIHHLCDKKFILLDVQYQTAHLKMFGAKEIMFDEYARLLVKSYQKEISF